METLNAWPKPVWRAAVLSVLSAAALLNGKAEAATCDRACLIRVADSYVAALLAHDPGKAPLAPNLVFVENGKRLQPGNGLWTNAAAGSNALKVQVPDVEAQQIGWLGVLEADGRPTMLALRLKVVDGRITEAEHIVARPLPTASAATLGPARPGLVSDVPASARLSRRELMALGSRYYDALDDNKASEAPFAPDCQRRENGATTAGEGGGAIGTPRVNDGSKSPIPHDCIGQIDSQVFVYISLIENRRMVAADPQTGLVMGFSQFRHSFANLPYEVRHADGSITEYSAQTLASTKPFDTILGHIFKIGADRQMHEIEAVGAVADFNAPSGWEGTAYQASWLKPR